MTRLIILASMLLRGAIGHKITDFMILNLADFSIKPCIVAVNICHEGTLLPSMKLRVVRKDKQAEVSIYPIEVQGDSHLHMHDSFLHSHEVNFLVIAIHFMAFTTNLHNIS